MDVASWLRSLGLGQYENMFRDNAVTPRPRTSVTGSKSRFATMAPVFHRRRGRSCSTVLYREFPG